MRVSRTSGCVRKGRRSPLARGQRGFVLIEVLIAMAIFGVISVAFLTALVTGYHGVVVAHDQTMAQSLTRTTFENIRVAPFPIDTGSDNVTTTSKFRVVVHADNINDNYTIVYVPSNVQMITVTIQYDASGRTIWSTQGIKVKP